MSSETESGGTTDVSEFESDQEGVIRIENLRKTFDDGTIIAIDDVNITIDPSEICVFLGPSGCGKTTTLRCVAGLETPDSGRVIIGNTDVTDKKPKDRNLAFVFQSIALFPHMSVRKNISFGLDMDTDLPKDQKNQRVEEVAEILGISELLDRKPSELSGGQQQRVSLGRSMVMEPAAFLLDEPFSALDANLRDQMRVETKQLQRRLATAMIFVTHDQEEAMTLGDQIVVMNDGKIIQVGGPDAIYHDPANEFVAQFIGSPSANFFDCEVSKTDGMVELVTSFFSMPISVESAAIDKLDDGQVVKMGIRPENLDVTADNPLFEGSISVVEPHGDRSTIHFTAGDGVELTALTDHDSLGTGQTTISVDLDREKIWLFDQNGDRLL